MTLILLYKHLKKRVDALVMFKSGSNTYGFKFKC